MKNLKWLPCFFLLSLFFYSSCEEPFPQLPPETQTGEQTFGCLVNNELVLAQLGYGWDRDANAEYLVNNDRLIIEAQGQFHQRFILWIDHPYDKRDAVIDSIRYLPPNSDQWMTAARTGQYCITRMDARNDGFDVVSGTFSFQLNEAGKTPVSVTKGRFDLRLNIYYFD